MAPPGKRQADETETIALKLRSPRGLWIMRRWTEAALAICSVVCRFV